MARDRLTFRQRDVKAAIKAVTAGGLSISRVKVIKDGVDLIIGETDSPGPTPSCGNKPFDFDLVRKQRANSSK